MYFENFTELYMVECNLLKIVPLYKHHFQDLDKIYKIVQNDSLLIHSLTRKRILKLYCSFEHSDKLPPDDFLSEEFILVYQNLNKIIELIESMENNSYKYLNKWKLDQIEKVLCLGWKEYCKIYIDKCLNLLPKYGCESRNIN